MSEINLKECHITKLCATEVWISLASHTCLVQPTFLDTYLCEGQGCTFHGFLKSYCQLELSSVQKNRNIGSHCLLKMMYTF
jgi:hypothetical protein